MYKHKMGTDWFGCSTVAKGLGTYNGAQAEYEKQDHFVTTPPTPQSSCQNVLTESHMQVMGNDSSIQHS